MDLDPTYTDRLGDPLIRLTLDWTDHERAQANMAIRVSSELAKRIGGKVGDASASSARAISVTYYQSTHVQWRHHHGCVSRSKRSESLGRSTGKCRTYAITGGSTFPQSASGNPTPYYPRHDVPGRRRHDRSLLQTSGSTRMKRREFLIVPAERPRRPADLQPRRGSDLAAKRRMAWWCMSLSASLPKPKRAPYRQQPPASSPPTRADPAPPKQT